MCATWAEDRLCARNPQEKQECKYLVELLGMTPETSEEDLFEEDEPPPALDKPQQEAGAGRFNVLVYAEALPSNPTTAAISRLHRRQQQDRWNERQCAAQEQVNRERESRARDREERRAEQHQHNNSSRVPAPPPYSRTVRPISPRHAAGTAPAQPRPAPPSQQQQEQQQREKERRQARSRQRKEEQLQQQRQAEKQACLKQQLRQQQVLYQQRAYEQREQQRLREEAERKQQNAADKEARRLAAKQDRRDSSNCSPSSLCWGKPATSDTASAHHSIAATGHGGPGAAAAAAAAKRGFRAPQGPLETIDEADEIAYFIRAHHRAQVMQERERILTQLLAEREQKEAARLAGQQWAQPEQQPAQQEDEAAEQEGQGQAAEGERAGQDGEGQRDGFKTLLRRSSKKLRSFVRTLSGKSIAAAAG